ncbi:TraB/GumN family protein [Qipengyuania sphaerica]|uniref:TraB/GumN family protein n=1 Tax=Qipengyuania sphaerica TaxID=2867243 RepID=UPI001C86A184|nr:TraB/GumN family protein [Qipengyuania sphaerica]MBX7540745.1 TraB/GumN family protein [Qipengyuania sphaerica]
MKRFLLASCTSVALALGSFSPALAEDAVVESTSEGPALWKVADEDTTIYLFGTVHVLPKDVKWFGGDIAEALESADTLVTEIPADAMKDPALQASVMQKAMLPEGHTLRGMLSDEDRAVYEEALGKLGMPPGAFDRFEPWFAGMTLSVLPLMKEGYDAESGVEKVVEAAASETAQRGALETADEQIDLFDTLPPESQVEFLMSAARDIDGLVAMMDEMVAEWLEGDADELAAIMNREMTDPALAAALLYNRNERWAEWIDERLEQPGAVFIAVGAGHLAGEKSVQDYLVSRDIEVTRVQ